MLLLYDKRLIRDFRCAQKVKCSIENLLAFIYAHVEVKLFPANQRPCVNNMLRG